jgi:signal transduction histidine kinase
MNTVVKAGVVLGVLVVLWTFVMGWTGWYKDPAKLNLFYCVIPIQIAVLVWALRRTAAEGRGFGGQVGAGLVISLIAGVFAAIGSVIFTGVAFPNYFQELASIQERMLREAGSSEAEIRRQLASAAQTYNTPMNALFGFIGTMITGLLVSMVIAIFVRARPAARTQPATT